MGDIHPRLLVCHISIRFPAPYCQIHVASNNIYHVVISSNARAALALVRFTLIFRYIQLKSGRETHIPYFLE